MSVFNEKSITYNNNENSENFHLSAIGILSPDKNYVVARDSSENNIIEFVVDGIGYIEINGITSKVKKGDCYCIREGSSHRYYSDENNPYTKLWISVSGRFVNTWLNLYGVTLTPFIRKLDITDDWQFIKKNIEAKPFGMQENIVLTVHNIIFKLGNTKIEYNSSNNMSQNEPQYKDKRKLMLDAKKYIEKSSTQTLSLDELSKSLSISKSQLIRLFKKQYNITPYAYSIECKLHIACTLLETSDISIDEIASKLCFYDRNHFNKNFYRKYKTTPAAYRKNHFDKN